MKKILSEDQRDTIDFIAGRSYEEGLYKRATILRSILTSVDEAEKRLAELEPPDLRTEELTFEVTYDANIVKLAEVTEEIKNALNLSFTRVDLILPGPEDIIASPGEGFRWVDDKEILQEGDQCRSSLTGGWEYTSLAGHEVHSSYFYRRRLSKEIL